METLKDVFDFTIESQLLYHAPLSFEPTYGKPEHEGEEVLSPLLDAAGTGDMEAEEAAKSVLEEEKEAWLVGEEEMKVFVNSEKWSLGQYLAYLHLL